MENSFGVNMISIRNVYFSSYFIFVLVIHIFGQIGTSSSESFAKNGKLSQNEKSPTGFSGELMASSSSRSSALANPRLRKFNETEDDDYETETSSQEVEEYPVYERNGDTMENEIDTENEDLEKSETFPEITQIANRLSKKWEAAFHRTRKAIFGAPRFIAVRYHKSIGKLLGLDKHKKEKKKKHKKKKHHHHHHESDIE